MSARVGASVGAVGAIPYHIQVTQLLVATVNSVSILYIVLVSNPVTEAAWLWTLLQRPADILDLA